MGYTVHNFQPNEVLHASELNEMDAQILKNVQNTATIQTTNVATKNFVVGEYLTYNGILYEVTSAIASGGTITPGSNCTQTNTGAELKEIKESLSNSVTEIKTPYESRTGGLSYTFPDTWYKAVITVLYGARRCETTVYRTDVSTTDYYHYMGGYLTSGNNFGASIVMKPTSFECIGVYQNGSDVKASSSAVVRLFKA